MIDDGNTLLAKQVLTAVNLLLSRLSNDDERQHVLWNLNYCTNCGREMDDYGCYCQADD